MSMAPPTTPHRTDAPHPATPPRPLIGHVRITGRCGTGRARRPTFTAILVLAAAGLMASAVAGRAAGAADDPAAGDAADNVTARAAKAKYEAAVDLARKDYEKKVALLRAEYERKVTAARTAMVAAHPIVFKYGMHRPDLEPDTWITGMKVTAAEAESEDDLPQ